MALVATNDLTEIMPKILARALLVLRERCIMPRLVNSDYSIEAAKKGITIDIPTSVAVPCLEVQTATVPIANVTRDPGSVKIALDQWYQNYPLALTDKELCEIDENEHFLPMQLEEAVKALASNVNQFIVSKYKGENRGVYGYLAANITGAVNVDPFGAATTPTAGVSAATGAKRILNQQLCPRSGRVGVLNFDAEASALDLSAFSDAEKIMSAVVKMEGEIGRKFGINWVADDDVTSHTAGSVQEAAHADLDVHTAVADVTTTPITAFQLMDDQGGTVLRGDILKFANHDQTYVVIGGASYTVPVGGAGIEVNIMPALQETIAQDEAVVIMNDHAVNMVFHPNAFAFATRPLLANSQKYSLGNQMLSMQDPITGLILRLEVSRQHKQTVWELDILYGADLVEPRMAMRLAGAP